MKIFFIIFLFSSYLFAYPQIPNSEISSGDLCTLDNPDFVEYRYDEKIPYCVRNVSTKLKKRIYKTYGIAEEEQKEYTIDHIVPLSIGGSNCIKNLWPEHFRVKATRPNLEKNLYEQLKNGEITQKEAIKIILDTKFNCCDNTNSF